MKIVIVDKQAFWRIEIPMVGFWLVPVDMQTLADTKDDVDQLMAQNHIAPNKPS
jgi:hypothetical protein